MSMFLSALIPLTALNAVAAPQFYGREAHALFLSLVQRASPALADLLHADDQRKPFTVSGLRPHAPSALAVGDAATSDAAARGTALSAAQRRWRSGLAIRADMGYALRVTSLSAELSSLLLETLLPHLPATLRLGEAHFQAGAPLTDAAAHTWAGQTSADALLAKWFARDAPISARVEAQFASPTAIKGRGGCWSCLRPRRSFRVGCWRGTRMPRPPSSTTCSRWWSAICG